MHTIITSFTKEGYAEYGKQFLETFKAHWKFPVRLVVYPESFILSFKAKGVDTFQYEKVPGLSDLLLDLSRFSFCCGQTGGKYNINFDARCARKSYMLAHAVRHYGNKVFWLDADTVTHADVPETLLDECLPDDKLSCYLGRDGWFYTESGFLGYNTAHPAARQFNDTVTGLFRSGAIFTQKGWHDCYAYDLVRSYYPAEYFNNIAADLPAGTMHPFINSVLGEYMDHKKGPRKSSSSTNKDLVVPREAAYWKDK